MITPFMKADKSSSIYEKTTNATSEKGEQEKPIFENTFSSRILRGRTTEKKNTKISLNHIFKSPVSTNSRA